MPRLRCALADNVGQFYAIVPKCIPEIPLGSFLRLELMNLTTWAYAGPTDTRPTLSETKGVNGTSHLLRDGALMCGSKQHHTSVNGTSLTICLDLDNWRSVMNWYLYRAQAYWVKIEFHHLGAHSSLTPFMFRSSATGFIQPVFEYDHLCANRIGCLLFQGQCYQYQSRTLIDGPADREALHRYFDPGLSTRTARALDVQEACSNMILYCHGYSEGNHDADSNNDNFKFRF